MKLLKKCRDLVLGILVGAVAMAVLPAVSANNSQLSQIIPFKADSLWLLKQARAIIEAYQVDAVSKDISEEDMVYGAMRGMIGAWKDPYTRFVTPQQLEEEQISYNGKYGGLGITIGQKDGKTLVISPIEDTPADRVGMKPMDQIVKVDNEIVLGWDLDKIVKLLRGEAGKPVTVWVRREKVSDLLEFKMVREIIKLKSVRSQVLSDDIGYIRLSQFINTSGPDVGSAVIDLKNKGVKGLILDLRNNGGGLLNAATDICDLFLDGGLIVSTKGRVDKANDELFAHKGTLTNLPLTVLINEGSASASEIVSGALRDRKRAILVGQKSFGKGSVQTLFNLSDGSAMYVTIARYFTPSGTMIDHVGLTPDIQVKGELTREISADAQLQKAKETVLKLAAGASRESLLPEVVSVDKTVSGDHVVKPSAGTTKPGVNAKPAPIKENAPKLDDKGKKPQ